MCTYHILYIYTEDSWVTDCRSLPKVDIDRGIWFIVRGFGFQLEGAFRYGGRREAGVFTH